MAATNIPVRMKGQTSCFHHKGRQLELYCETCPDLACLKCVSTIHKGHLLCELGEITDIRKQDIRDFVDRIEQSKLVEIDDCIASTNTLLNENDIIFEQLSIDLIAQSESLKQDLDMLTAETLSLYQKMKEDNNKLIHQYKQDLEIYDRQLKHQIKDLKEVLQQGSPIEIYDTECEIDSRLHLPVKPMLGTVSFIANTTPRYYLELALGIFNFEDLGQASTLRVGDRSVSLSNRQGQSDTRQQSDDTRKKAVTRGKLLTENKVVDEWVFPCSISSICPTTDDKAWAQFSDTLTLLNRTGTVIKEVTHKTEINNISLSPTTHRPWACDSENNILELVSGQLSERFRTLDEPRCICVTSDNHVIIGMSRHITKYTTQGQMVLTTEAAWTATPLVCSPWRVTECPITNNVAVIDASDIDDGGDDDQHVDIMDSDFRKLFMYRGDIPTRYKQTAQLGGKPFIPCGIMYDSQGNIIISDYCNDEIHILHGDGEVLRILNTNTDDVWDIGISNQDVLWSVNSNKDVKLIQYYK